MAKRKTIPTQRPNKGDLVAGHRVYAVFPDLPAVPGEIVETSKSGHSVTMKISGVLGVLGLPRRTVWTWREDEKSYQQKGTRTKPGIGLVLDRRGRSAIAKARASA